MIGGGPVSTNSDAPVTLMTLPGPGLYTVTLINVAALFGGGYFVLTTPLQFSLDGVNWATFAADKGPQARLTVPFPIEAGFGGNGAVTVLIRRIPGGTDLTAVYGIAG